MMAWNDIDHSYSRHWSEHFLSNTSRLLTTKDHFTSSSIQNFPHLHHFSTDQDRTDDESGNEADEIDVCAFPDTRGLIGSSSWHCAEQKVRTQMNECERHVASLTGSLQDNKEGYWEETINKTHWNAAEAKLFSDTVRILMDEKLARLACKESDNEIVMRRLSVDRSASRLRASLVDVSWSLHLTQWLHVTMMDCLPPVLLACYLDIIQTLRSQAPTLVERMIMATRENSSSDRLSLILKRPWDPAITAVVSTAKQKPGQAILFVVLQCNASHSALTSRRLRFWNSLLSQIGKVVQAVVPSEEVEASLTVEQLAQHTFRTLCAKVRDFRSKNPNRKVVLVGWHATSIINCQVSLQEQISAIICLGFPLYTMFGKRGDIDDVLCDVKTPTLFVTGEHASSCDVNDLEDVREKTFTETVTSLVVVGGADDWLNVSEKRKRHCYVTQPMVDRKILEGISDFLVHVFPSHNDEVGKSAEVKESRKRATQELTAVGGKRQRPDSPQVHRSSSTPLLSQSGNDQKRPTQLETSSKLRGLSFDLQTGSMSSLTSVPPSSAAKIPSKADPTPQKRKKETRSITIDLAKDTNEQLAPSKRKPLLQPTKKQTEDAVAAILGGSENQTEIQQTTVPTTSTTPAISSTSSSFSRYVSTSTTTITSSVSTSTTSQEFTFGKRQIGNLKSESAASKSGLKPVRSGFGRFHSIDQSVSSRTRGEDRETQQATAILEQLTSSFDGEPVARPPTPELFPNRFSSSQTKNADVSHRRLSTPQPGKPSRSQRAGRVRTRGGGRDGRFVDGARKAEEMDEKSNVRYVMTSPNVRGGNLPKRGGNTGRRLTLMPEFGSTLFASAISKPATSGGARILPRPVASKPLSTTQTNKAGASVRPKITAIQKPLTTATTKADTKVGKSVKHIVYLKKKADSSRPPVTEQQALAKLVTGQSGDRAVLSISRPGPSPSSTSSVSKSGSGRKVGMPSLILTKLPNDALCGVNVKNSES